MRGIVQVYLYFHLIIFNHLKVFNSSYDHQTHVSISNSYTVDSVWQITEQVSQKNLSSSVHTPLGVVN